MPAATFYLARREGIARSHQSGVPLPLNSSQQPKGKITMSASNQKSGLAITSLVLGVLSMLCFGLFLGIPAIITGHIAYSRSRKSPEEYGGGGLAIAGFVMGYVSIFTTVMLIAMFLPALFAAKTKAQSIACMNHMKEIGIAMRVWGNEHGDQWPFNVSTNKGGTMELCLRDDDGFDRNAAAHFAVLSRELMDPRILVCPADVGRQPATSFQDLKPDNVTYQLRSGANPSHPDEILLRCPIHENILRADGSVELGKLRPRRMNQNQ
jgi:hypothetical protein